jgi:hypothetical protein
MGVAVVPGGLTTLTLGIEAELREDLRKRSLALDIRNMFNEMCRLCAQEDLLQSGELVAAPKPMSEYSCIYRGFPRPPTRNPSAPRLQRPRQPRDSRWCTSSRPPRLAARESDAAGCLPCGDTAASV